MVNSFTTKEPGIYNEERTVSSINSVGKTGQPHAKEWNWTTILYHTQKLISYSKWTEDLNIRLRTVKLLEENIGKDLLDMGLGNDFLKITPKSEATK